LFPRSFYSHAIDGMLLLVASRTHAPLRRTAEHPQSVWLC
jgi:hypothetical protein